MKILKYIRKPFVIEAVQVTEENMLEVAGWCEGQLLPRGDVSPNSYVKVKVYRPMSVRQSQAFPGDWVLKTDKGFKVYSDVAFNNTFDVLEEDGVVQIPSEETHVTTTLEFNPEAPAGEMHVVKSDTEEEVV